MISEATTIRRATCMCGQLAITCEGEPVRISMCHCIECQRRTGSAFGIQARFARERVTTEGRSSRFERIGDSGGRITHDFCPTCGSTVFYEIDKMPGVVAVPVGAFGDPGFPSPKVAVYEARRHPWAIMPGLEVEHHD